MPLFTVSNKVKPSREQEGEREGVFIETQLWYNDMK